MGTSIVPLRRRASAEWVTHSRYIALHGDRFRGDCAARRAIFECATDMGTAPALHAIGEPLQGDMDLVRAAAAGDKEALRAVIVQVGPAIVGAVRATTGAASSDLEDVVQDSLMALVAALPVFRGECSLAHFARRIAVRRAVDVLRASGRSQRQRAEDGTCSEIAPEQSMVERRQRQWRALLAELPAAQAEALVLRAVEGCTVEEIAQSTGAPIETVRSRLRLAKTALRERIASDSAFADLLEDA
jgi:RNA polymerase sigma-70 factor (ECF subfamily)